MSVKRKYRLLLGLVLCLSAWNLVRGPAASAQASPSDYQSLIEQGLREYELGNFGEARAFFQRAHQQSPNARTLRGLGMASYELRHYVEAVNYFQSALASQERPLTAQMHTEVSQLLTQARSFITHLRLQVTPVEAQLRLDTRELIRDREGSVWLDPGTHELVVEASGYETMTRSIRCEGGETLTLALALRSMHGAEGAQASAARLQSPPLTAAGPAHAVAAYIVMGTGAAVAVAGGVLLTIALRNKHAVENPEQTAAGPRYADYQGKADSVLPLSAAGIAAMSLGLAGVAAGLAWRLTSSERAPETTLALSPAGFMLSGHL